MKKDSFFMDFTQNARLALFSQLIRGLLLVLSIAAEAACRGV